MTNEERKQRFLARIRSEGRSSPEGKHWADFHALLIRFQKVGEVEAPPVPLILAASGESNRSKHQRLSEQLDWAIVNGCFDEAILFLESLSDDKWNTGASNDWNNDHYWSK